MLGRNLLVALLLISAIATVVADLGFMHASNDAWPGHAKLHAIWGVFHVLGTHSIALWLLCVGTLSLIRARAAALILLAYTISFFIALALAPLFGGAAKPDVPENMMPPTLFGLDGNILSFLVGLPVVVYAWWRCEREIRLG